MRVLALDVGQTKTAAAVMGPDGTLEQRATVASPVGSRDELLAALAALVEPRLPSVEAIGVAIAATIDTRSSLLHWGGALPVDGFDLRAWAAKTFARPIAVENDANAAALGEHRAGAGRGCEHLVMLTLGTGIGGGVVLGGRLYRGARGSVEPGHMTLDLHGAPCLFGCPGRGHLEALASGTAADALASTFAAQRPESGLGRALVAGEPVDARLAARLAAKGDEAGRLVFETIGSRLGVGVASLVNVLDPELVVLGGGLAEAGELLFAPVRAALARELQPWQAASVRVVPAQLGVDAGLVGAAHLARELRG